MVTPIHMLLLRFQVSAVVNAVATANPEYRVSSRSQTSQIFRWQHRTFTSAGAAMIAVQLATKRGIDKTCRWSPPSLPAPQIQNAAWRHDRRRANSFAHSHIRRRRHDHVRKWSRSPFNSHRNAASAKHYKLNSAP